MPVVIVFPTSSLNWSQFISAWPTLPLAQERKNLAGPSTPTILAYNSCMEVTTSPNGPLYNLTISSTDCSDLMPDAFCTWRTGLVMSLLPTTLVSFNGDVASLTCGMPTEKILPATFGTSNFEPSSRASVVAGI